MLRSGRAMRIERRIRVCRTGVKDVTEREAMRLILEDGNKTCLYADEYSRWTRGLGMAGYMDLRSFCVQQGARDIREWLMARGLYRNVERDMRAGSGAIDPEGSAEAICAQILENEPLAGEPVLADAVLARILARAQAIFDEIAECGKSDLSAEEQDVMAIAMVQHIKRRNLQEDGKSDKRFWAYIYTQFGYRQDNDKANANRVCNVLRRAVRGAFLQHDRFFSSEEDAMQCEASLRLHALMPVQSMESLFEILLFFYVNDLEFNYVPEDPIFKALVHCIATRWDEDAPLQEELNLRSNAMASGLKALFRERPGFMRVYCERIVQRMDALVRGVDVLKPDSTLDGLLRQWYAKKEEALKRRKVSRERSTGLGVGGAISSAGAIRLRYVLEKRRVCISVPPIRLENRADADPWIEIYQGKNRIYRREMEVYGRLSWTTREMRIRLDETDLDYGAPLAIEATITCGSRTLLGRDGKLHRNCIVFNERGREVSPQSHAAGFYYLFANACAHIDAGKSDLEWIDGEGQLVWLYVDADHAVRVNGAELFLSGERQGEIRACPSVAKVNGLRGRREGETFNLYSQAFALDLRLPDDKRSLNYHAIIDGSVEPLSRYCPDGQRRFVLEMPKTPGKYHSIKIVEWATERLAFQFNYAILPSLRYALEGELLYDDCTPATVRVCFDGCDFCERVYPPEGTDWAALSTTHLSYDLEVRLPIVRGALQGQSIFALPSTIWRENIADSAFVQLQCPPDWSCELFLGASAVPRNAADGRYELGNCIKAHKNRQACEALTLVTRSDQGLQDRRELTRIAFEEYFTESPVSIEDGMLTWHPTGRYVGGDRDEFQLILDVPGEEFPFSYSLNVKGGVFDRLFVRDYPCGEFPFRIIKRSRNLLGAGADRVLFEGTLTTGAPEQRRVLGKCLKLTRARCWDQNENRMANLDMADTAGVLLRIQFQGYSIPSGESIEYPEYVGDLYFHIPAEKEWQMFNDREKPGFEWINPVRVWIISDQLLILRTAEGEAPYIDRQYNSIILRSLHLSGDQLKRRRIRPDYFAYRME